MPFLNPMNDIPGIIRISPMRSLPARRVAPKGFTLEVIEQLPV